MATETLILRPTHSISGGVSSGSSTGGANDELWLLVSEEIADDDATWVDIEGAPLRYGFTVPDEYLSKTPTNIRIYARAIADDISTSPYLLFKLFGPNDGDTLYQTPAQQYYLSTSYQTFYEDIANSSLITSWYSILINRDPATAHLTVMYQQDSSSSKGGADHNIRLTQLYLELTYDDESASDAEIINFKQNGAWISISGDIYKKQNGVWVLSDSSELQEGFRYTLNVTQ